MERNGDHKRGSMTDDQLLEEHRRTWHGFVRLIMWSTAGTVIILILMALFLL